MADDEEVLKKTKSDLHRDARLTVFAHYQIQGLLGRGGMGTVYKALDTRLKRIVALKILEVIADTSQKSEEPWAEAVAMAQVDHPNIVKIYEIGESPAHYISMEYIDGFPLSALIYPPRITRIQSLQILTKVADALYSAHKKGIIHRDIKPSNIMIDKQGEPKLMDFGLAKIRDTAVTQASKQGKTETRTDKFLGTPVYMAPEQIEGRADVKSDIYSMGATFYEVLTGRPPYQGETFINILHQMATNDPIPPRDLNPDISVTLEAICLKCLEKNPQKRYINARQLERDFKNYMDNRPVIAKPYNTIKRMRKFLLRHKLAAALAIIVVASFLVIGVGYTVITRIHHAALIREKREALAAKEKAEKASHELEVEKKRAIEAAVLTLQIAEFMINNNPDFPKNTQFVEKMKKIFDHMERLDQQVVSLHLLKLRGLVYAYSSGPLDHKLGDKTGLQKGIADYNEVISKNPRDALSYANRALLYLELKQYAEAARDFDRALSIDKDNIVAYANRGVMHFQQGHMSEAKRDFDKAIDLDSRNTEAYNNRSLLYVAAGRYAEAEHDLDTLLTLKPDHAYGLSRRGTIYAMQGKYWEAERDLTMSIQLNPQNAESYLNRAGVYDILGKIEEAERDYTKGLQLAPQNARGYANRGSFYHKQGNYIKAIENWQKAIELDPLLKPTLEPYIKKVQMLRPK